MQFTVTYMEMPHNKNLPSFTLPKSQYFTDEHKRMQILVTIQHFNHSNPLREKAPSCLSGRNNLETNLSTESVNKLGLKFSKIN